MSDKQQIDLPGHYGGAVAGEQFWPRPDLVDDLVETLLSGESVSLFGLRRIGKSSLMKEAARVITTQTNSTQASNKHLVIEIDAQDFAAFDKILTEILLKLPSDGHFEKLRNKLMSNKYLPKAVTTAFECLFNKKGSDSNGLAKHLPNFWQLICDEITQTINESGTQLILMIDEFPFMCKNLLSKQSGAEFVDTLLATFRQWRTGPITMVISGSIGMQHLVRAHQIEFVHFNDCIPFDVPPFTNREDAEQMLTALVNSADLPKWHDETTKTLLDELAAYYPSFIQYAFSRIKAAKAFKQGDIEELFAEHIRPRWDATFFDQFDARLKIYELEQKTIAISIFIALANAKQSNGILNQSEFTPHDDLGLVLKLLAEDGFLRRRQAKDGSQSWRFSSPLIDIWWAQSSGRFIRASQA